MSYSSYSNYGDDWFSISRNIRRRDKWHCRVCGKKDKLYVHHITPIKYFHGDFEKANHPDNLISLCLSCHMKAHAGSIPGLLKIPKPPPPTPGNVEHFHIGQSLNHIGFGVGIVQDISFEKDLINIVIKFDEERGGTMKMRGANKIWWILD